MKKIFALMIVLLSSRTLSANPVYAPQGSTWVKIESMEVMGSQINIRGYVEGSTTLYDGYVTEFEATSHCMRTIYMMMDKPGKFVAKLGEGTCTLKAAK